MLESKIWQLALILKSIYAYKNYISKHVRLQILVKFDQLSSRQWRNRICTPAEVNYCKMNCKQYFTLILFWNLFSRQQLPSKLGPVTELLRGLRAPTVYRCPRYIFVYIIFGVLIWAKSIVWITPTEIWVILVIFAIIWPQTPQLNRYWADINTEYEV